MSSSPSPAPETGSSPVAVSEFQAEPFSYGEAVLRPGQTNFPLVPLPKNEPDPPPAAAGTTSAPASSAADVMQREAQCREEGRAQGLAESRAKFEEQLGKERAGVVKAIGDFSRERTAYYEKIEEEAVRLALSIARKILHREAQIDPLLLMGIARVALGKIEGATGVALLVHPQRAAEWRKFLAAHMEASDLPEVVEDPLLAPEQCVLRTSMGSADLSLEVQLKEIENGLMDLLAARPKGDR